MVNVDIEAARDGTLARVLVDAGGVAPIGAPIAVIARPGESVDEPAAKEPARPAGQAPTSTAPAPPPQAPEASQRAAAARPSPAGQRAAAPPSGDVRASPLARRLAEEHGIPLASIRGTGPEGRITKEDVEAAIAAGIPQAAPADRTAAPATAAASPAPAAQATAPAAPPAGAKDVPLTRMRATIARRMTESKQQAPHIYLTVGIAMDAALAARRRLNERLPAESKISVNDLVIKAAALALTKHPNLNASFVGNAVRYLGEINISMAVPVPDGLIAPTLYGCDHKLISQIAQESKALIERARAGHLKPEDLSGGTFTVSNLGTYGVDWFVAIINPPQSAILAVGTAKSAPVVKDGQVGVATIMQVTLSADHRVTDGAGAAEYLAELRQLLENPAWVDHQA